MPQKRRRSGSRVLRTDWFMGLIVPVWHHFLHLWGSYVSQTPCGCESWPSHTSVLTWWHQSPQTCSFVPSNSKVESSPKTSVFCVFCWFSAKVVFADPRCQLASWMGMISPQQDNKIWAKHEHATHMETLPHQLGTIWLSWAMFSGWCNFVVGGGGFPWFSQSWAKLRVLWEGSSWQGVCTVCKIGLCIFWERSHLPQKAEERTTASC